MIVVCTSVDRPVTSESGQDIGFEFSMEATFPEEEKEYVKQLVSGRIETEENFEKK